MNKTITRVLLWSLFLLLHQKTWSQTNQAVQFIELTQELIEKSGSLPSVRIKASGGQKFRWSTGASTQSIEVPLLSKDRYTVEIAESDGRLSNLSTRVAPVLLFKDKKSNTQAVQAPDPGDPGCLNMGLGGYYNRICSGTTLTLVATGGTSYRWEDGTTNSSITVSPTQSNLGYKVTITYTNPQDKSQTCTEIKSTGPIEVVNRPTASITGGNINICGSGGYVVLNASGGAGLSEVAYQWSTGETSSSISRFVPTSTSFGVTVSTGSGLCSSTASTSIGVTPFTPNIQGASQICLGTGTLLTATGGSAYRWDNNSNSNSRLVTPTTLGNHTYTVTITSGSCSTVRSHTVTVSSAPTAQISGPNSTCYNGSVTLTASGSGNYAWSTGANTSSISTSLLQSTQTYRLTVTNPSTQCSSTDDHVVNVLPQPTLNEAPNSICAGETVNLSVSGGSTYSWNVGGTTSSIVHNPSSSTEYRVTVTNASGCSYVLSKSISVNSPPVITFGGGTSICAGQSLNITAFGGSNYAWSTGVTAGTITVSPTVNTTYTVTATSSVGCVSTAQRAITVKASPIGAITGAGSICPGQSVSLTASGGTSYAWNGGASTASITVNPTQNTNYTVSISNAQGCTLVKSHSVAVNITGSANNDGPLTCSKTSVNLQGSTGASGATFQWKNAGGTVISNSANATVAVAGTYTLEIIAAGGCHYSTSTQVLSDLATPVASASNNGPITCSRLNVTLSGSSSTAGVTYQWKNSSGTVLANAASTMVTQTGVYTLEVRGSNGCAVSVATVVSENKPVPQIEIAGDSLICSNQSTTLTASGGTTYLWSTGASSSTINTGPLTSTTRYTVTVTNAQGCTSTKTRNVSLDLPIANITGPTQTCVGSPVTLTASGGQSYQWSSNAGSTATVSVAPTTSTTYTVTLTDVEGCTASKNHVVAVVNGPTASIISNNGPICAGNNGLFTVNGTAGATLSYQINAGATATLLLTGTNQTIPVIAASANTTLNLVSVSSPGSCTTPLTASSVLTVRPLPSVSIESNNSPVCRSNNAVFTVRGSAGATLTYRINGGSNRTLALNGSAQTITAGAVTSTTTLSLLSVSSGSSPVCTVPLSLSSIVNIDLPAVTVSNDGPLGCSKPNVTLSASSTATGAQFVWKNALGVTLSTTATASVASAGVYTVEVQASNGCKNTANTTVTEDGSQPNLSIYPPSQLDCYSSTGWLQGSSTTAGVSYEWRNANNRVVATQASFYTNIPGVYTLKVTTASGCSKTQSVNLGSNYSIDFGLSVDGQSQVSTSSHFTQSLTCSKSSFNIRLDANGGGYNSFYLYFPDGSSRYTSSGQIHTLTQVGTYVLRMDGTFTAYDWETGSYYEESCTRLKELVIKDDRPLPQVGFSGDSLICVGKNTVLTASGGVQYLWSTGATTASITTPNLSTATAYTVTVTSSCGKSAVGKVTVKMAPSPVANITGATSICVGSLLTLTASGGQSYQWSSTAGSATTASVNVNPTTSTTYTVTTTDGEGCTAIKSHLVSTKPLPNFTLNGAPAAPFCGQGTINLSVSTAATGYTWRWSTGETSTSIQKLVTSPQTFTVTAIRSNGCTLSQSVNIGVIPLPQAQITGGTIACYGNSTTLTASSSGAYLWSTGATTQSITITPLSTATYAVTLSNALNCSTVAQKTVVVPEALSLSHDLAGADDCIPNNTAVIPIVSGGTGSISLGLIRSGELYVSTNLSGLISGTYLLRAEDTRGCIALNEVLIKETPVSISELKLSGLNDCTPGNTQLEIVTTGDRLPLVYRLNGTVLGGKTTTLPRTAGEYTIEVEDAAGCVVSKEDYFDDYDALGVLDNNIVHVSDCSTPNGAIHMTPILRTGDFRDYSLSVDGGTTWHNAINLVLNLPPGKYPTSARSNLHGCTIYGPEVQINAPDCLPEAGFTQSVLHFTSPTQRIALPWRVDQRPWGDADQPFSLHIYRVGDGKPHFVDPNIATATEPLEKSLAEGSAGFTVEYAVDFEGSDERELVLQPNAAEHLEPGSYTFMMEGEGVEVDPFRKEIKVIVDLDGRVIVTPIDDCPGIDITLTINEGECWDWEGLNQPNQRSITVKHVQGRIYTVNYLENLVKKSQIFVGDDQIDIPVKLDGIKAMCPGDSYNIWWYNKDRQFGDNATSSYASDWKAEWVPHSTFVPDPYGGNAYNVRRIAPTETTTYKVIVTYIPTGCKFELTHTVEVDDLLAGINAKENSKILCYGNDVTLDIENPQNVNLEYTWTSDNGFTSSSKPPLKVNVPGKYTLELRWLGKSCSKTIEFDVKSNDPCEIKEYFESNGFYAIPINIHSTNTVRGAELRSPCQDGGEQVKDDSGLGFDIQGDPSKEAIDLKGTFETSLAHFSTCFGYSSSKALISENEDICSCDDYLATAEKRMKQSGLQYWSHVFEGKDCDGQDYLFIKAKMPDGSEYGSNGADFLNAGLNYALQVAQNKGGRLATSLILDHMLDNFVEAKTPAAFSQAPPQKLPEPKEGFGTMFQPSCIDGKKFISANVFAADGKLIQLPPETVWRFDIDPKVKVTEGVLTGYTLFKDDALIGIYTGRKKINTEEFLGYYLRGASTNICKPETFTVPDTDENGFLYADVGKLVKQRFVDYANCGRAFEISLVHIRPNSLAVFPFSKTVTPQGPLFTGKFSDLAFANQYSSKPVYSYNICPEALGDVAPNVGTDYSRLGVNLFYNAAESSIMYQIKDSKGNPLWLYVRAQPGSYVNGCLDQYTYYIWNCKIATWQEINPNDSAFKNDCDAIQKLFKAFENSQLLHKVLSDVSFIPIVGDIASLANGIIYLAEGDIGRGKTELFWAVVGVAGDLIPLGGAALRLVNTVGGTLSPGTARIIAIVKLVPCQGAPSLVETELLGPCRIAEHILDAARTSALNAKLQELGFKFGDATTKLLTEFIHNNRLGSDFHTWLKDANVEHLAVIFKTGLEDLKWPVTKLEDLVDDLMRIPGLLAKMAENANLINAWDVLSASPIFRQNEVHLERLASLGFDWANLKSSFANALLKGEEHVRKWLELKIPKTDLEKTYQNGLNDIPTDYEPYSIQHKAQRWEQHKLAKAAKGETPNYESWSNVYDGGIDRTAKANENLDTYYNSNGWSDPPFKKQFSVDNVGPITTSKGNTFSNGRRFDVYDIDSRKAIEYKEYAEGVVYKSEDIELEALKDAFIRDNGGGIVREVEWVFKGCKPSGPLRELLEGLGIKIVEI